MPDGRTVVRWHKLVSKDLFSQINFEAEHPLARYGFRLLRSTQTLSGSRMGRHILEN